MKQQQIIKVTVMLEKSFWIGLFERNDEQGYAVARKIFGDEPTDAELYQFILMNYNELKFTEPQEITLIIKRKNPKRIQREVKREMEQAKKGLTNTTHAQEVLRLELEKNKKVRKIISRVEKQRQLNEKFILKQEKKKKKQRGH